VASPLDPPCHEDTPTTQKLIPGTVRCWRLDVYVTHRPHYIALAFSSSLTVFQQFHQNQIQINTTFGLELWTGILADFHDVVKDFSQTTKASTCQLVLKDLRGKRLSSRTTTLDWRTNSGYKPDKQLVRVVLV